MRFISTSILRKAHQRSHFVYFLYTRTLATHRNKTNMSLQQHNPAMENTSGVNEPVWVATMPFSKFPLFSKLTRNIETDVLVVGTGITGISTAYELVEQGRKVTLVDARNILSGETARTSGHLSSALDDHYYEILKTFGQDNAKLACDSHQWALEHVGEVSKGLNINCEYRMLPGYVIVDVPETASNYEKRNDLPYEVEAVNKIGYGSRVSYEPKGEMGAVYKGGVIQWKDQATFHPTKYLVGLLEYLRGKPDFFDCYTNTRFVSHKDHGDYITATMEEGQTITAKSLVIATNIPLNVIEILGKVGFWRTYCIAMRAPKGKFPDMLVYDNGKPYIYVKKTEHPNPEYEYVITGGEDRKVGTEAGDTYKEHFAKLEKWTREHFPFVEETEYKWSGQIVEPNDYMAFIGRASPLEKNVYLSTGDSGNGLTHGVIASRIITDMIMGVANPWAKLYSPNRLPKLRTMPNVIMENAKQIFAGYSRYVFSDVTDIEDIPRCSGAVMKAGVMQGMKPLAVYRDEQGNAITYSAVCPHLKGVVAWNAAEKSWDCPVHGSRFDAATGRCVMGPSNRNLYPENDLAKKLAEKTSSDSEVASLPGGGAGAQNVSNKVKLEAGGIPGAHKV